jgi:hypothetical protein
VTQNHPHHPQAHEGGERRFDPARYLRKLGKGDYLEVKWRLLWLRTEHPDAVIETELVRLEKDPPMAVFRARVAIPGGGSATGWGQEEPKDFGDYLEKAETKALGRALAALGYGTQFTEDFDFAEGDPSRVVDSPVDRPAAVLHRPEVREVRDVPSAQPPVQAGTRQVTSAATSAPGGNGGPVLKATEPQIKAIYAIARGAQGMDDAEIDALCRTRFGCAPSELTRRQASEFIDFLKRSEALG